MAEIKEIVGAVAFADGVQLSFRISRTELDRNGYEQLGRLLRHRIEQAQQEHAKTWEAARG